MGQGQSSDYSLGYRAGEFDYIYRRTQPPQRDEYLWGCSPSYRQGYEDGKEAARERLERYRQDQ